MNISTVTFANGVALHTLHLPSTVTKFVLKEARSLTDVITQYQTPTRNADKSWNAQRGLYIQGLTDAKADYVLATSFDSSVTYYTESNGEYTAADPQPADATEFAGGTYYYYSAVTSDINHLQIVGGNLGYNSFDLLHKLYKKFERTNTGTLTIGLEEVHWTPYTKLEKGYVYNAEDASKYYIDNEHYQLEPLLTYNDNQYASTDFTGGPGLATWNELIRQGMLYIRDTSVTNERIATIDDL